MLFVTFTRGWDHLSLVVTWVSGWDHPKMSSMRNTTRIRQMQANQARMMQQQGHVDQKMQGGKISVDDIDFLVLKPERDNRVKYSSGRLEDERLYIQPTSMMPPQVAATLDTINKRIRAEVMRITCRNKACIFCDGSMVLLGMLCCPIYCCIWPCWINPQSTTEWNQMMKDLANIYIQECNNHNASNPITMKMMWMQGFKGKSDAEKRVQRQQGYFRFHDAVPLTDAEALPFTPHKGPYGNNRENQNYEFFLFLDVSEGPSKAAFKEWLNGTVGVADSVKGLWAQQWPMKAKKAMQAADGNMKQAPLSAWGGESSSLLSSGTDVATQIAKLKKMKDDGILSEEEFTAAKAKALGM